MMDRDKQGGMSGAYQALLRSRDYESDAAPYIFDWIHFPLLWYYGTYLFYTERYHDPRERPGLAACAIAALVLTVALAITLIVLLAQRKLLVFVL
ncbi:unnamed protein product [Sphagnum balticum]